MRARNKNYTANGRIEKDKILQSILGEESRNPYLKMDEKTFLENLDNADTLELRRMCEEFALSGSGQKESVKERIKEKYLKDNKTQFKGQYEKKIEYNKKEQKDIRKALDNL